MSRIANNELKDSGVNSGTTLTQTLEPIAEGLQDMENSIDVESDISWFEGEQEMKGIVIDMNDDIALVEEVDEVGKRTGEFYEIEYAEAKLRTFVVTEKADEMIEKGAIVSWDTSKGKYYGDIAEVVTKGMARGEPQGLEIEGSKENPAYVIRVWMQADMRDLPEDYDGAESDDKAESAWHMTNTTVVARGDGLKVEEALPTGQEEDDYNYGDDDEEPAMKSIDKEFRAQVEELIKANSVILERLAEFDTQEKSEVVVDEIVIAEVVVDEVKSEQEVATTQEPVTEEVKTEEAKTEEAIEEVKTEELVVEALEEKLETVIEEVVTEETSTIELKGELTFDDLKEFHNLLKDISN